MNATVAVDLHRRRSVVLGRDEHGEELPWVRLVKEPDRLVEAVMSHGEAPDVAIEATYGWYWAVDALQAAGASVHLVAPARVAAFEGRRVKNDISDCRLLVDLLRAGLLPEAWIAPPECRQARELVRHRAKLVALRSGLKSQIHAVLAKCGVPVNHSHLFDTDSGVSLSKASTGSLTPPTNADPSPSHQTCTHPASTNSCPEPSPPPSSTDSCTTPTSCVTTGDSVRLTDAADGKGVKPLT